MKSMLVGIGLFIVGFGAVAAFSGGLPTALFDTSDGAVAPVSIVEAPLVTLGDYGDAVEIAYERMLSACSAEDRKAYGRAMNALAVAKRHADTGKIERGDIGGRVSALLTQFVDAVRKGVITNDHVPFGSLRTVIASVQKNADAGKAQPEPTTFTLRGSIGEAAAAPHNDCQVL
jgi:hypothetical protein